MLRTQCRAAWLSLLIASVACARAQRPPETTSILQAKGDSVRLELVSAATAEPVANAAFELFSDNGIRCIKAPCPTDGRSWSGRTDANGRLVVPKSALNTTAQIKGSSYYGDVIEDASPTPGGMWRVELFAEEGPDPAPHPLKLIDSRTRKPIANAAVRIETRNGGGRSDGGRMTSNSLGYIFVPFTLVAASADNAWLIAPGYRDAQIDYAYARRKMLLVPK